jgi:hypothetical protein
VIFLLGYWESHTDYQSRVAAELAVIARFNPGALYEYELSISKLYILNLDILKQILSKHYSLIGRPSENQPEIFRAFIIMNDLRLSPEQWAAKVRHNVVLRTACGFRGKLPGIASYYDFIDRIFKMEEKSRHKQKRRKPKKKYGKEKMPAKNPGIVHKLVKRILKGCRFNNRPELLLQEVFAKVCVRTSIDMGLIPQNITISGDGTCVKSGACPYGRRTCKCVDFFCNCPRKFSDPNATWGWDSHNERYFYGYTGYFISTYNSTEKLDLPLYLRFVGANRHDSVSAVVALAELKDLLPDLTVDSFLSDSASDNYATYELLDAWNINAIIALNKTNSGNLVFKGCSVNGDGIPICPAGHNMVNWGFCSKRSRIKWRCPRVCGKCELSDACASCSPSDYGRTVYTKPDWDLRLFTRIPRGTVQFKDKMKERTAAERVNNRILNHYGLENARTRGKKRISFFATVAAFNIHLDAQLAKLKATGHFNFDAIFGMSRALAT